jgi:hypothetical protein
VLGKPSSFPSASLSAGSGFSFCSPFLEPPYRYFFMRAQSLYRCMIGKAWFGYGFSSIFSK